MRSRGTSSRSRSIKRCSRSRSIVVTSGLLGSVQSTFEPVRIGRVIRARRLILLVVACVTAAAFTPTPLNAASRSATQVVVSPTAWMQQIRDAIGGRHVSVAVGVDGVEWFQHLDWVPRPPASNEKLLLSMALLSNFSPTMTIATQAASTRPPQTNGVLRGNLWIIGTATPRSGGPTWSRSRRPSRTPA